MSGSNPWESAVSQVASIRPFIAMSDAEFDRLTTHHQIVERSVEIQMDSKEIQVFKGFRSQHNNALGPYKGGLRFHQDVSREEVMALSMWMTWKTAVAGLPLGGGKGGIIVDPKTLSDTELEKLSRAFMRRFKDVIGHQTDVPAPDVNTNPQIMDWMVEECKLIKGKYVCRATFTGKPVENGGSLGRVQATGRGGFFVLEQLARKNDLSPEKTTIAVQGIGNVAYWFAKLAIEAGYKVVAVSDSRGAVVTEEMKESVDLEYLIDYKTMHGSLAGADGYRTISNQELLELPVDILVPAAMDGVITTENAEHIKAARIIELANGPITASADDILKDNGVEVVPDILANAGGVTVSYFEWLQNTNREKWTEKKVNQKLKNTMEKAFEQVWQKAVALRKKHPFAVSLREAAYVLAVSKVLKQMRLLDKDRDLS